VGAVAGRRAERLRAAALTLLTLALIGVILGPVRVVEGLDVLTARHDRAPLTMSWLASPRVVAQPPGYTRESERGLLLGIDVAMVPDAMPVVDLESAPRVVKLVDVEKLDIKWTAHDDHGLREVDLVLRSGPREDRRVLGRFDGETKFERGGHSISARDAFL